MVDMKFGTPEGPFFKYIFFSFSYSLLKMSLSEKQWGKSGDISGFEWHHLGPPESLAPLPKTLVTSLDGSTSHPPVAPPNGTQHNAGSSQHKCGQFTAEMLAVHSRDADSLQQRC